jgi:hypothetical protein
MRFDRGAQHLVMRHKGRPHRVRVGLPPTGRTLHIGEQKRHHPRRSSRRVSGHPRRIPHRTRAYLVHRLIRPGHRIPRVLRPTSASRRCRLLRDGVALSASDSSPVAEWTSRCDRCVDSQIGLQNRTDKHGHRDLLFKAKHSLLKKVCAGGHPAGGGVTGRHPSCAISHGHRFSHLRAQALRRQFLCG